MQMPFEMFTYFIGTALSAMAGYMLYFWSTEKRRPSVRSTPISKDRIPAH